MNFKEEEIFYAEMPYFPSIKRGVGLPAVISLFIEMKAGVCHFDIDFCIKSLDTLQIDLQIIFNIRRLNL
jgi:hypothetical protein